MGRFLMTILFVLATLALAGCDIESNTNTAIEEAGSEDRSRPGPALIMSGEQSPGVVLRLWEKPRDTDSGSNSAWNAPAGSQVEVYEDFIIVTDPDGVSHISQHGYYTGLAIITQTE